MGKDPGSLKFSCRAAGSTNGPSALWGTGANCLRSREAMLQDRGDSQSHSQ